MNKISNCKKIGEILHEDFNIPQHYIEEVLIKKNSIKGSQKPFGQVAIENGLINEEIIYKALAKQYEIDYISNIHAKNSFLFDLYKKREIYSIFNNDVDSVVKGIKNSKAFPAFINFEKDSPHITLYIAISDISSDNFNFDAFISRFETAFDMSDEEIAAKREKYNKDREKYEEEVKENKNIEEPLIPISKVKLVLVSPSIYSEWDLKYKGVTLEELKSFSNKVALTEADANNPSLIDVDTYLKMVLTFAIINDVSDIHIEPSLDRQFRLSMRFKGFRQTIDFINIELAGRLIAYIKNVSNMNAQNVKKPQDGMLDGSEFLNEYKLPIYRGKDKQQSEFSFVKNSFRISTYPTAKPSGGALDTSYESTVIRVLSSGNGVVDLQTLGLSEDVSKEINFSTARNQGIVLIVGPTGSGKSTTLYSTLSTTDFIKKKIISFEDPVEMRNMYWTQGERSVAENKNVSFDFLDAKKSILRQDPDIILMGEVRDEESAFFALEAANTGHLVFTTLHANSASASFERLIKLGIKPLELASAVLCVISQRLIRQVCPHCYREEDINDEIIDMLKRLEVDTSKIPQRVVRAKPDGCPMCNGSGYVGRTLLDEVIPVTTDIKYLVSNNKPEFEIRSKASEKGYNTMLENGIIKMNNKLTTIDEILRVI